MISKLLYLIGQSSALDRLLQVAPALPDSVPSRKQEIEMLKTLPFDELVNKFVSGIVTLVVNLSIAIVVFYVGKFLINKIHALLVSIFVKRNVDKSLSTFILSLIRIVFYFLLIVTVIGILGIETSSFIAIFASAGVALGMALSGTLQNFAGGVLILLLKPYKVGDYVEAQGYAGTIKEIQIFNTILTTPDNKQIIIPNGGLSTGSINNYSREHFRRVDWTVSISYGDNVDDARQAILDLLLADPRVVKQYIEDEECDPLTDPDCEKAKTSEHQEELRRHGAIYWMFHRRRQRLLQTLDKWEDKNAQKIEALRPKIDRSPVVWVSQMADSSVNLTIRAWTRNETYWGLYFTMNELFYKELPKHGIHFPFPQLDVHVDPTPTIDK